ncbi:MAG: PD-(D/E)XK motif protein [Chromatiales bacterium]|nr:PD-(D/E)XK motif protein [Chromatiales bacterium]
MSSDNPWQDLLLSEAGYLQAKRVDPSHPHDFFWARNPDGKYAFVLSLKEVPGEWQASIALRGISVRLFHDQKQLQLLLSDSSDWQMFAVLCRDLVECCRAAGSTREVMDAVVSRLLRWQRLLSRGPRRILDEREIRGLIGELLFLRDELLPRLGSRASLFWQGSDGKPQDFVVGATLFEVKTIRTGDAPRIHISSPDQLWAGGLPLYLRVIPLTKCGSQVAGAVTLPHLIESLGRQFTTQESIEAFDNGLAATGYVPLPEYAEFAFTAGSPVWYAVTDGFPMITAERLTAGLVDVKYSIQLSVCAPFLASPDWQSVVEHSR